MKLNPIASNMTQITLNDGTQVLFSYQTPVASWKDGQFYKTDKKWSNTTTRHINKWADCAITKPQAYFDGLTQEQTA
jgi:hypothetical protein